jgi:Xaa-Pro aminopeptidase
VRPRPRDDARLDRVRGLMVEQDLDAIVARAPDNVVYLTDYWSMKGYDAVVFPREGDASLVVLEPQLEEAAETAWTGDLRPFGGYEPDDPRPPQARSLDGCLAVLRERDLTGRVGVELSQGTQAADRMVGEPTLPTADLFTRPGEVAREVVDASGLLAQARAIKTPDEIERMRDAGTIARLALEHLHEHLRPGMRESEVGALFEGHVHAIGVGFEGRVRMARGFTLVWSGPGIRTFTATGDRPVQADEPTLLEIWVSADGYWVDLTKNLCPGPLRPEYERLLELLLEVYGAALDHARDGADLPELDRLVRRGIAAGGDDGQPSHPICHGVGARAHEPPYAHQAGTGTIREGMVLAIEPAVYWPGGGGLRIEDTFLVGRGAPEPLCGFPDDLRELIPQAAS